MPVDNSSGWYNYGTQGHQGEWNGHVWTGRTRDDSSVPGPPQWHRSPLRFLRHPWFWVFLGFWAASTLLGFAVNSIDHSNAFWFVVFAVLVFGACFGFTLIYWPHMQFRQLPDLGKVLLWGLVSGAVAVALAIPIEGYLEPDLKVPLAADLWLSGVIEETSKILVPIFLWIFGKGVFRDPRVGFLLVLVSGSVFGGVEGAQYILGGGENSAPSMALARPVAELTHAVWASIAATMIWFAAARLGRLVTWVGFVGWLMAAGLHSFHDGIASFNTTGTKNTIATGTSYATIGKGLTEGAALVVFSFVFLIIAFYVLKYFAARELVPPNAIDTNPPHWRPRMVQWAMPKAGRRA
ncbi:MAG: PrsW family glutamic-type intramembrane protease [Candidatus Nanopelagicales bacterium]